MLLLGLQWLYRLDGFRSCGFHIQNRDSIQWLLVNESRRCLVIGESVTMIPLLLIQCAII